MAQRKRAERSSIVTAAGRARLKVRREPYWAALDDTDGAHVGYRAGPSTWVVRYRIDGRRHYGALGKFEDHRDAFRAARDWIEQWHRAEAAKNAPPPPATVRDACVGYIASVEAVKGVRVAREARSRLCRTVLGRTFKTRTVLPHPIAEIALDALSADDLEQWRNGLIKPDLTGEALRKARASANREYASLIAALNDAHRRGKVASDFAWLAVKKFADVQASEHGRVLHAAHSTISTGGIVDAPRFGPGRVANRHADPRVLFFRDADSWLRYHAAYSDRTVAGIMAGHIDALARDIALVEVLGPNPHHAYATMRADLVNGGATGRELTYLDNVFAHLTGAAAQVEWQSLARFGQNLRNLQTAAKLGGAVLSSVTDFASAAVTGHFNRLPFLQHVRNTVTALNPLSADDVRLAQRAGLGLDTLIGEINRFADDSFGTGWTSKIASTVLRASGLQALTEANRRAFSVTMMSALGHLTRKPWAALEAADVERLTSYGFSAADWSMLSRVALEDWGGNATMLTPAAIGRLTDDALGATGTAATRLRNELVSKTLGMILAEESYAVVTPGVRERAFMIGQLKKGTAAGEIVRSLWLFKSFPVAVIARHWFRGWGRPTAGGRAAYLASYVVGSTVLGALALQLKDVAKGREPRDMDNKAFWSAAFLQGGGAGIFGDFVFSDQSRFGRSILETAVGPIGSLGSDVYDLTLGNAHQAARGEPTDAGAEAMRFVQANTPGMSLWYARTALDHLIFHQVQEYLSPGYLARMRRRVKQETGQDFWWAQGK